MADLTDICSVAIPMVNAPVCGDARYGYPKHVIVAKTKAVIAQVGDTPTPAEFTTAFAAADDDKAVIIRDWTNGVRAELSRGEPTGADTVSGLPVVVDIQHEFTGNIRKFSEELREDLLNLNQLPEVKFWIITNTGWCFGEDGYTGVNFLAPLLMDGFGTQPYMPVRFAYDVPLDQTDAAAQDNGYLTLTNP